MLCLSDVLSLTLPLSKVLQKPSLDLKEGANKVADTITVLNNRRKDAEKYFKIIWRRAEELSSKLNVQLSIPRRCGRQTQRANYTTDSPETYYRFSTYIPLLDHILEDMNERFSAETLDIFNLPFLFPENILSIPPEKCNEYVGDVMRRFGSLLQLEIDIDAGIQLLQSEIDLWRVKWQREKEKGKITSLPVTALEVLSFCDEETSPLIFKLVLLLATLPVSNATAERTFSTLRRLKTWLRSTMEQERLVGLALLNVHQDLTVDEGKIILRFSKTGAHRYKFAV